MKIKHLQLNTTILKFPEKVVDFIVGQAIDVACLQEVCYPIGGESPLKKLVEAKGYYYYEGVHFTFVPSNQVLAVAIVSKFPAVDVVRLYFNSENFQPKNIKADEVLGDILAEASSNDEFPLSRGLRFAYKSRCVLSALLDTPSGLVRVVSTHSSVSDLCTETMQMLSLASLVKSFVEHAQEYPTIFSGDLNIRVNSYTIKKLSEVMTCHTLDLKDTLSKSHASKKKDYPEGLAIDHVFSKGLKFNSIGAIENDFSMHKALVSEFDVESAK